MTATARTLIPTRILPSDRNLRWAVLLILAVTAARVIALALSPLQLYQDEAQYWVWSWEFDWGYFSKPPLIAWIIGLTTFLFGDSEFGVRAAAPILHGLTATFLAFAAHRLFDSRTALWAVIVYLTMLAVFGSSGVISTDAVLLAPWGAGLWAFAALRDKPGWKSAVGLGIALGLGMMAKYAMIYFVLGLGLAALFDAPARRALVSSHGLVVGGLFLLLISPNLIWNAANDFATVSHTAANANWGEDMFHLDQMAEFFAGQMIVFGIVAFPLLVGVMIAVLRQRLRGEGDRQEFLLLLFIAPAILIVTIQAFLSRANANWAASAYVAASILFVVFMLRGPTWRRWALGAAIAVNIGFGVFAGLAASTPAVAEATGLSNGIKRLYGWRETAAALVERTEGEDYAALVFDDRNILHQMQYYGGELEPELFMWRRYAGPINAAESGWPLPENYEAPVLVVSHRPLEVTRLRADFEEFEAAGTISIPVGGGIMRDFTLWRARGHQRLQRDDAYEENAAENDRRAREAALQD